MSFDAESYPVVPTNSCSSHGAGHAHSDRVLQHFSSCYARKRIFTSTAPTLSRCSEPCARSETRLSEHACAYVVSLHIGEDGRLGHHHINHYKPHPQQTSLGPAPLPFMRRPVDLLNLTRASTHTSTFAASYIYFAAEVVLM